MISLDLCNVGINSGKELKLPASSVRASFIADESIPSSTITTLQFDQEDYDNNWSWTVNTTDFVVPAGVNTVIVSCYLNLSGIDNGDSILYVLLDGTITVSPMLNNQFWFPGGVRTILDVSLSDVITVDVWLENGGNIASDESFLQISGYL